MLAVLAVAGVAVAFYVNWRAGRPVRPAGGGSPIAAAAEAGDFPRVRDLIAAGADVSVPAKDGATALLWASYHAELSTPSGRS